MKKGAIIIHGLTGTPATMAVITEALAKKGFTVITPLLAGHGTSPEDLSKKKWQNWYDSVLKSYEKLVASGIDEIFCAGISLGGLLSLKLCIDRPEKIKAVACIGTPLKLSPIFEDFLLPISHIPPIRQLIRMSKKSWEESVADRVGREIYKTASYPKIPVASVWEVQALSKEVQKGLANFKMPLLIIHSRLDSVAPPSNVDLLTKKIAPAKPEVLWLERSEHVATLDLDKDLVAKKISTFFSSL